MDLRRFCLLLPALGQVLLNINRAYSSTINKTINIGYIRRRVTPDRSGAINVAIEQAQNDGLLRGYNFRYKLQIMIYNSQWQKNTIKPQDKP